MCAAMKSTAEASSGWSIQTFQISPVVTGTWARSLHALDELDQVVDVHLVAQIVSLPTTMALTLLLCRARSSAERISRSLRSLFLSIQAPTVTFRPNSAAIGGTSSAPPVAE